MERGELGVTASPGLIFVFEGLIAHLERPLIEKTALRAHKWDIALDQWVFDIGVRAWIQRMTEHYGVAIDVITWHSIGFAEALHDRLWHYKMQVHETRSTEYRIASPEIATDPTITAVYDADPEHRWGYGFKCREFSPGQL